MERRHGIKRSVAAIGMAAAVSSAMLFGGHPVYAVRPEAPKIAAPGESIRGGTRRQRQRAFQKALRRQEYEKNRAANLRRRNRLRQPPSPEQRAINKMSNWQRTQFSRALAKARRDGRKLSFKEIEKLATMPRRA